MAAKIQLSDQRLFTVFTSAQRSHQRKESPAQTEAADEEHRWTITRHEARPVLKTAITGLKQEGHTQRALQLADGVRFLVGSKASVETHIPFFWLNKLGSFLERLYLIVCVWDLDLLLWMTRIVNDFYGEWRRPY